MPGNWWDRFTQSVMDIGPDLQQFGMRAWEETGFRDIWDELAAIDDDGMSLSSFIKGTRGAIGQTVNMPLQLASVPALEANRALGAVGITAWQAAHGEVNADPFRNFLTGGQTYAEQQSAPGVYKPLTLGDLRVVGYDHALNEFGSNPLMETMGRIGFVYHGTSGAQRNGSYLPAAWDLSAPDAGDQLDKAGVLGTQRAISNIATETLVDPLNYLAPGAGVMLDAYRGSRIVATAKAAEATGLVGTADLTGAIELAKVNRRVWGIKTGMGLMSQPEMVQALSSPEYASLRNFLVREKDPTKIYRVLSKSGIAQGDGAYAMAHVAANLDTPEEVIHLFNAAAYRNVESITLLDDKLENLAQKGVAADFDSVLGVSGNVIDDALTMFKSGERLPEGYLLSGDNGKALLDRVLQDNPATRAQWEKLSAQAQKDAAVALSERAAQRAKPQEAMQRLFGTQTSQVDPGTGLRIVENGVQRTVEWLPAARKFDRGRAARMADDLGPRWAKPVQALKVDQSRFSRFRPSILLLTKPGVRFNLHDADAIDKFNDLIRWADARIGSVDRLRHARSFQTRLPGYRFAQDPEVQALVRRFMDAGVQAGMPAQTRGDILDELQLMVIRKMGNAIGFAPEASEMIAREGMRRGREAQQDLLDARKGYLSVIPEDGLMRMLSGQAAAERQAANHVPIMDWDAIARGMATIARGDSALVSPSSIVSEAVVRQALADNAKRPLKYLGESSRYRTGHTVIDAMDVAGALFKQGVLLRVGYTFRNLTEGFLSIMASGVSTADVLRMLDTRGLITDRLHNMWDMPSRVIDRTTTWLGLRANLDASLVTVSGYHAAEMRLQDRLHHMYAAVSNPDHWDDLAARAANLDGSLSQEEMDQAERELEQLSAWRHYLGLGITAAQEGNEIYRPTGAAAVGARLWHADPTGSLKFKADATGDLQLDQPLDRPIRLVEDPVLATAHTSQGWTHMPTSGANAGDRLAAFQQIVSDAGGGTHFQFTDKSGKTVTSTSIKRVLAEADPNYPVTLHQAAPTAPTPAAAPAPTAPTPTVGIGVGGFNFKQVAADMQAFQKTYGFQQQDMGVIFGPLTKLFDNSTTPPKMLPGTTVKDITDATKGIRRSAEIGRQVRGGIDPKADALDQIADRIDAMVVGSSTPVPAPAPAPRPAPTVAPGGVQVMLPPPSSAAGLRGAGVTGDTHHIQMRMNPNSPWVPFDRNGVTPTTEIRTLDKATNPGFPRAIYVDTWSPELDLRDIGSAARAAKQYRDIDEDLITAARSGDHSAQDHLSEVMAGHGIYRIVLPDNPKKGWGRYQVLAHPKAIDGTGFKDAVTREVDEWVNRDALEAAAEPGAEDVLGVRRNRKGDVKTIGYRNRREMRALNKATVPKSEGERRALVGAPVDPKGYLGLADILDKGGFSDQMEEAVSAATKARTNRYIAQGLVSDRVDKITRLAKRSGISTRATANMIRVPSMHGGEDRVQPALLNGIDGGLFRSLSSGDASYLMSAGQTAYLSEAFGDLYRSVLTPRVVEVDDYRWFDALANLLGRHFFDQPGSRTAEEIAAGTGHVSRKLDPVVAHLMQPGDRDRLVAETIDWAIHTEDGKQWVRTLGLQMVPGRHLLSEWETATASAAARTGDQELSRQAQRSWKKEEWLSKAGRAPIAVSDVTVGDAISTMASFLDDYVLTSPTLTQMMLDGNVSADALRAAYKADPWERKPVSGLLSPTSAESRALMLEQRRHLTDLQVLNSRITRTLGRALRTIGSTPETRLLRHPVFEAVGQADLRQRIMFAEETLGRPVSIAERNELTLKAQQFALKKVEQTLYTLSGRNAVDDYLRFVAPFFPAWRNALTRWGRFARENPLRPGMLVSKAAAIGRQSMLVDSNGVEQDWDSADMNHSYLVVPSVGGLLGKIFNIPGTEEAIRNTYIPLRSLDVIFGGEMMSPGTGPFIAVPAQMVMARYPEWWSNTVVKRLAEMVFPVGPVNTGDATWDKVSAFLPSGVRRTVDLLSPLNGEGNDAWASEYTGNLFLLQSEWQEGTYAPTGGTDAERAESLHRDALHLTELKMTIKAFSAFASPVASQQRGDREFYAGIYRQLVDATGDTQMASEQFNKMFPSKFLLKERTSANLTGGASTSRAVVKQKQSEVIARLAAEKGDMNLLGFWENYDDEKYGNNQPSAGFTTQEYNPFARLRQEQTKPAGASENETYRRPYSPDEALKEARIAQGQQVYSGIKSEVGQRLLQQGLAPGSYEFQKQFDDKVSRAADVLEASNPIWADDFKQRDGSKLYRREQFFQALISDPSLGFLTKDRADDALVLSMRSYLNARDAIRQALYQRAVTGGSTSTASQENVDLAMTLGRLRTGLENGSPAFRQWADRWFPNDVVTVDNSMIYSGEVQ